MCVCECAMCVCMHVCMYVRVSVQGTLVHIHVCLWKLLCNPPFELE